MELGIWSVGKSKGVSYAEIIFKQSVFAYHEELLWN